MTHRLAHTIQAQDLEQVLLALVETIELLGIALPAIRQNDALRERAAQSVELAQGTIALLQEPEST